MPIGELGEVCVWIEDSAIDFFKNVFTVGRCGRPVHQAFRFIGAVIKEVHADDFCDQSGNGSVFVRRNLAGEWNNHAKPGFFECMAVGRIDHALVRKQHLHRVDKITTGVIGIKGYPRAAFYRIFFTSAALEMPENIATYIFCGIATVFGESFVFGNRLCRAAGHLEPLAQLIEGGLFIDPPF